MKELDHYQILVVDDEENNHKLLRMALSDLSYEIISTYSASEALDYFRANQLRVVLFIIDVQMPECTGFELFKELHKEDIEIDRPVIFISSYKLSHEDYHQGYELGGFDYIRRPVLPKVLQWKVKLYAENYLNKKKLIQYNKNLEQINLELHKMQNDLLVKYSNSVIENKRLLHDQRNSGERLKEKIQENKELQRKVSEYMEKLITLTEKK
jgi:DNA-binding response OmpR family regulator